MSVAWVSWDDSRTADLPDEVCAHRRQVLCSFELNARPVHNQTCFLATIKNGLIIDHRSHHRVRDEKIHDVRRAVAPASGALDAHVAVDQLRRLDIDHIAKLQPRLLLGGGRGAFAQPLSFAHDDELRADRWEGGRRAAAALGARLREESGRGGRSGGRRSLKHVL